MTAKLTFELADEIHAALQAIATKTGRPVERLTLEWLLRHRPLPSAKRNDSTFDLAWERLAKHLGAQDLGRPTGAANPAIDADLARET